MASGSLLPELLPALPTPGEPLLVTPTAVPVPWEAWFWACVEILFRTQCTLCAWNSQMQGSTEARPAVTARPRTVQGWTGRAWAPMLGSGLFPEGSPACPLGRWSWLL